jgi:ribosomal protein L7Ae-like RNA K-turn-binding protein
MEIQSDFRDLLELFNKNSVEYVIVTNKRAVGRKKDLADLEALSEE